MTNFHLDKTHQANRDAFEGLMSEMNDEAEADDKKSAETFHGNVGYEKSEKYGETRFKVDLGTGRDNHSMSLTKPEARALFNKLYENRQDFLR